MFRLIKKKLKIKEFSSFKLNRSTVARLRSSRCSTAHLISVLANKFNASDLVPDSNILVERRSLLDIKTMQKENFLHTHFFQTSPLHKP